MKIIHKIGINPDNYQKQKLCDIGINVSQNSFQTFEIEENSEQFMRLKPYIEMWELPDMINTEFTNRELNAALLLVYNFTWVNGYPQPEDDFGYIGTTYKKEGYCKTCGTGLIQQAPFRLKKEPNWGTKKMFELNWVFDEIFVRKEVYEEIFKKYGIEAMPVFLYKKDVVIENTVQLNIPSIKVLSDLEKQPFEICKTCGTKKYNPQIKGFFPPFKAPVEGLQIFKGQEYFGSGASAHKKIFLTQELYKEMQKYKIKSEFIPLRGSVPNA